LLLLDIALRRRIRTPTSDKQYLSNMPCTRTSRTPRFQPPFCGCIIHFRRSRGNSQPGFTETIWPLDLMKLWLMMSWS